MNDMKLGAIESRFADIIWNQEPIKTGDLFKMAEKELGWKRQTSYTILRRMCEKGLFQIRDRVVTSLISREEFFARQSEQFVEETFEGSLPAFLAAFGSRKKLSGEEIDQLKKVIESMRKSTD